MRWQSDPRDYSRDPIGPRKKNQCSGTARDWSEGDTDVAIAQAQRTLVGQNQYRATMGQFVGRVGPFAPKQCSAGLVGAVHLMIGAAEELESPQMSQGLASSGVLRLGLGTQVLAQISPGAGQIAPRFPALLAKIRRDRSGDSRCQVSTGSVADECRSKHSSTEFRD